MEAGFCSQLCGQEGTSLVGRTSMFTGEHAAAWNRSARKFAIDALLACIPLL